MSSETRSDKPGLLDTNPELFDILNHALGTMHYHRLMSALNENGYQIVRVMPIPPEEREKDAGEEVNDAWARGEHIPGVTR